MCGISGFNFEDKSIIKKMCDLIIHRGPDDVGIYTDSEVSIGVRRLSIIDLETGHQPQHNEDEDIWIVFNGEIYNFKELRSILENNGHNFYTESDTEVIIHAYEEWGLNFLNKLRGQFAFCIYDCKKDLLILARDHLGLKPLYYYYYENNFVFASEIKCILCHEIEKTVNKRSLNLFLSLKYVPFNQTLLKKILKLPPSSYLIFDLKRKELEVKKYWDLYFNINQDKSANQFAEELRKIIEESVKLRLLSDVPLGAFLSGGIDSTAIVGIMSKFIDEPVKTFSIGFEEGAPVNELEYSRFVADYYNTDHTEIIVKSSSYVYLPDIIWHLDDLIADAATIPIYLMAKHARKKMTVALTGDGADEIFAGYSIYYRRQKYNFIKFLPDKLLSSIMKFYKYIPIHILRIGLSYLNQSKTEENRYLRKIIHIPDEEKIKMFPYGVENISPMIRNKYVKDLDLINQFINWDLKFQLPNQFNMKLDKMTMAVSLESRIPFLDHKLVEFSSTIPPQLKLKGNIEKFILRLAVKNIIPSKILKRKKTGFTVPINMWLRTGLREISGDILDRLKKRKDLLKPSYINVIKRNRFNQIFENRVWNLIMFELWYETFIENDGLKPINIFKL